MTQLIAQKNREMFDLGMALLKQAAQNEDFASYLLAGALCRQAIIAEHLRLHQLKYQRMTMEGDHDASEG